MSDAGDFDDYLKTLGRLTSHVDPTASTPEAERIVAAADRLGGLLDTDLTGLAAWVRDNPGEVPVLGLAVGLSQEKLKNALRDRFDTTGWHGLARSQPVELVSWLDAEFDLVRMLRVQMTRTYTFADILVARAGSRVTATRAGASGRRIEDEIEDIARDLGLDYTTRSRFTGRNGRTAPADLIIGDPETADIVVAAKGFDSTGSKLTDAVREIEEMAEVRLPKQLVLAVIDGIGWKSRQSDLRRIHQLWADRQIDGMYTLVGLDRFRDDVTEFAQLRRLI
ncbi:hypothetical protein Gbro_0824 [Gordonia bronchialis DSM 43247]|uniref:Restriction endonuclease type II DpnII-like domain-containing protein n=1 Tax=Gordonia bronchialis (strain ATCC 25592 / DSM 43247 / BCRC 13721 / JCM 3198 / KCTC 3076 / NBRC 16047 / NCTC 10667) TaxID=526226 RepID=D0L3D8_GORB4|nr:hypothetical protein [Gordonia bronchialis]ACY20137.1 hypothetical protein Gbro_0824 [Gordonia bronchialis DSM 43247]MCC3322910.1 hypothetical protein [Gordonia bronchialis]QGS26025.1 hypothetical protein FOB84_19725 [Gordonia bronchialis]STQ62933.1 Uncharacterised protein [Gordonia bronchialis]